MKQLFRKLALSVGVLALGGPLLTPMSAQAQDPIVVGGNYELSGYSSSYGVALSEGLELAVEEINAAGGLLDGVPVEANIIDNKSDKTETASIATRMIEEGVVGILGPGATDLANAEKVIVEEGGMPTIFPAATADDLTFNDDGEVLKWVYRMAFTYTYQANAAARFSFDELGATRAVVLTDSANDYSTGQSDPFIAEFERLGGEIVTQEFYTGGETDFSAIVTKLASLDFDVIYLPAFYTEGGLITKQAREFGLQQPILSGHGFATDTFVELAGAHNATDVYYTSQFYPGSDDELTQSFVQAYEAKFNKTPDTFAAFGYDAANLLFDAINRAGSTEAEAVIQAIGESEFQGVTGVVQYDDNHNLTSKAPMRHMVNGEIVDTFEVDGNPAE